MSDTRRAARLELEDGTVFEGVSFGSASATEGEVVFSTGMVGYPQSLTDPSYHGQILVLTYPLVGNYGVPKAEFDSHGIPRNFESPKIQAQALVVSDICDEPSHHRSTRSLSSWLQSEGIPGISGIDTRALTRILREKGTMRGKLLVDGAPSTPSATVEAHPVAAVSCPGITRYEGKPGRPRIVLVDCGVKANIVRILLSSGSTVIRVPWNSDFSRIDCEGIFVSNGPGDPKACTKTIASLRKSIVQEKPVFGICLGNQLLALAAGADTYKLLYGHRSQNQPALERHTGRCYMTSQNHGYAVREDSLPSGWEPWFVNGNDGTIEGIKSLDGRKKAVQFHPEGCPGPRDTAFLIDEFIAEAANYGVLHEKA